MTDRERLLQILNVPIHPHLDVDPLDAVVDYLLDNGVTFGVAVPGHENNYDISEMAYNNGYAKGCEDSKHKWIPVSERLPNHLDSVLCYTNFEEVRIWQWHEGWKSWIGLIADYGKNVVTHWMPLPEPPKEE